MQEQTLIDTFLVDYTIETLKRPYEICYHSLIIIESIPIKLFLNRRC